MLYDVVILIMWLLNILVCSCSLVYHMCMLFTLYHISYILITHYHTVYFPGIFLHCSQTLREMGQGENQFSLLMPLIFRTKMSLNR